MATISTAEAARTLVHYIELALGDRLKGDMRAELANVVEAFAALDADREASRSYLNDRLPPRPMAR